MHSLRYRCKTGDGTMSGGNAECIMQNAKFRVIAMALAPVAISGEVTIDEL